MRKKRKSFQNYGDRNCVEVVKDGADTGYTVSLKDGEGTLTITATTPAGNEIVISKSDDSFVMTATKEFAEALGLDVYYMGSDTPAPSPSPTPEPTPTPSPTPEPTPTPSPTPEPTPTPSPSPTPLVVTATVERVMPEKALDLTNPSSYKLDGVETPSWNGTDKALKVNIGEFTGIVFKNLEQDINEYKYVTITYTATKGVNAYIFDRDTASDSFGQGAPGETQKTKLVQTDTERTITYEANIAMHGLKLVNVDGGTATCAIKSVVFSKTNPDGSLKAGETAELSVSVDNDEVEIDEVDWSTLGGAIVETKADDNTKAVVTAVKAGTVKVFAKVTAKEGKQTATVTATYTLNVQYDAKASMRDVPDRMYTGRTSNIKVSVDKGTIQSVTWKSGDENIATVEGDSADPAKAVITAKTEGTVTITAEVTAAENGVEGRKTVTAEIEVWPAEIYLDLTQWNLTRWDGAKIPMKVNDDRSIELTFDNQDYFGAGIQIPDNFLTKYREYKKVELSVTSYREDGTKMNGGNQIAWNGRSGDLAVNYGDGVKSLTIPEGKVLDKITINAQESGKDEQGNLKGKQIMKIQYIKFIAP